MSDHAEPVRWSYRAGEWFAVLGEDLAVLLPPTQRSRAAALYELVDDGAGLDEVLDALVSGGLRELPGFALVAGSGESTTVLLRGPVSARLVADGDPVDVDASGFTTWVEQTLAGVSRTTIIVGDGPEVGVDPRDSGPDDRGLAVDGGIVRVSRLHRSSGGRDLVVRQSEAPTEEFGELSDDAPAGRTEDAAAPPASRFEPSPGEPPLGPPGLPGPPDRFGPPADGPPSWLPADPSAPPPAPPGRSSAWAPPDADPLFGARTPQDGVVEDEGHGSDEAEPEGVQAAQHPPSTARTTDHDGMTRVGDWDPEEFARPVAGIPGQPPAPAVTARPVARLHVSTGETVDVDRVVLVGRAPQARRFTASEQPRLLSVPSKNQEISSTHLEIRPGSGADHGSAVVTDLGSTNGTVVVQPGLAPEDLTPGIAVQLLPGAVIDLGDGVTVRVTNP